VYSQDRNQTRQYFIDVWHKANGNDAMVLEPLEQLIAQVIEQHPEYHKLLDNSDLALGQDYLPESGHSNPFLHMGMHIAIHEQLGSQRPAGIRQVWTQLSQRLGSSHEAEHQMMECLAEIMWQAQRDHQPPDEQAYLEKLKALSKT